jgi:hypothetical protein
MTNPTRLSFVEASTDKTKMPGNSLARVAEAFEAPDFFEFRRPIIYYMVNIDSDNFDDSDDSDSDETDSIDSGIGSEIDPSEDNDNNNDDNNNNNDATEPDWQDRVKDWDPEEAPKDYEMEDDELDR